MSLSSKVYVIGAGGHAKVVIRAIQETGNTVTAIFDDNIALKGSSLHGISIAGPVDRIQEYPRQPTVIAIGDNFTRRRIAKRFDLPWFNVIHPMALVDPSVQLGTGVMILARAIVQVDSCIGDHVIINHAVTVDHDCILGDFVHLAPGVHLSGGVTVGTDALLGIGAVAIPGVRIGSGSIIGGGAAVVRDLPENVTAVGVPAKAVKSGI